MHTHAIVDRIFHGLGKCRRDHQVEIVAFSKLVGKIMSVLSLITMLYTAMVESKICG